MTFYAAACQTDFPCPSTRAEIADRTRRMCAMVEQTIIGYEPFFDVRLLAKARSYVLARLAAELRRFGRPNAFPRAERLPRGCTRPAWPWPV